MWRALNAKEKVYTWSFRSVVLKGQPLRPVAAAAAAPPTLLEMLNIRSQLRAAESETLGRGPAICFKEPSR